MDYQVVNVFAAEAGGGNPAPVVLDATAMSDQDMQALAVATGLESAFVLPAEPDSNCDFAFRFWVPGHEMSMCGHATIGAVWLLRRSGLITTRKVTISTASGIIIAQIDDSDPEHVTVEISQPEGVVEVVAARWRAAICEVIGVTPDELVDVQILNSRTSRVKTLVPLRTVAALRLLSPRFDEIESLCTQIGSTGLYPYVVIDLAGREFEARQFPQSSGYPEDPATGIAAAALAFGVLNAGIVERSTTPISVRQGMSMGRPSRIEVRFNSLTDGGGCWISGGAELESSRASS